VSSLFDCLDVRCQRAGSLTCILLQILFATAKSERLSAMLALLEENASKLRTLTPPAMLLRMCISLMNRSLSDGPAPAMFRPSSTFVISPCPLLSYPSFPSYPSPIPPFVYRHCLWFGLPFRSRGWHVLLAEFCGRVLFFLASVVPMSSQGLMNLMGKVNPQNSVVFEKSTSLAELTPPEPTPSAVPAALPEGSNKPPAVVPQSSTGFLAWLSAHQTPAALTHATEAQARQRVRARLIDLVASCLADGLSPQGTTASQQLPFNPISDRVAAWTSPRGTVALRPFARREGAAAEAAAPEPAEGDPRKRRRSHKQSGRRDLVTARSVHAHLRLLLSRSLPSPPCLPPLLCALLQS